ncbi:MAG: DinB family protein [Proteobacteria bacterium]|nr:DinB family protein [Pseudomonadota bacterium]MDE3208674.1 DinB family protein [Pseudomonadota bacterium]
MASYNQWMNARIYAAAGQLSPEALVEDRKAFFHSVQGTLNHLVVADIIWLKRFAAHPSSFMALDPVRVLNAPSSLDEWLYTDFTALSSYRDWLDRVVQDWAEELKEEDLSYSLSYTNMKGLKATKNFFDLILHFFNHQTHHRGQVTTLLSQAGVDVGVTDLLALIPNESN